jgi:hypothetical protein
MKTADNSMTTKSRSSFYAGWAAAAMKLDCSRQFREPSPGSPHYEAREKAWKTFSKE